MSDLLTDRGRELVAAWVDSHTPWCEPCGISGVPTRARVAPVTRYIVGDQDGGTVATVYACRSCFEQARKDGINIVAMTPVAVPASVTFMRGLLAGEALSGAGIAP